MFSKFTVFLSTQLWLSVLILRNNNWVVFKAKKKQCFNKISIFKIKFYKVLSQNVDCVFFKFSIGCFIGYCELYYLKYQPMFILNYNMQGTVPSNNIAVKHYPCSFLIQISYCVVNWIFILLFTNLVPYIIYFNIFFL